MTESNSQSGIERACDVVGGQTRLAAALKVTPQAVSLWVQQGFAPPKKVRQIARLTNVPKRALMDPELVALATE